MWRRIAAIPFGETLTYGAIAGAVGRPGSSRAVGAGCGGTPIAIVVPCHRVVGANGRLTGYGGGLERKAWLLGFERGDTLLQRRADLSGETFPPPAPPAPVHRVS